MADAVVQEAVYKMRYVGGDSVRELTLIRQAAEQAALGTDKLATSEERLGKSSLNMVAALDPRIKAEQVAARQLEHFSRLHADGAITNERYAGTLRLIENNLKTKIGALDGAVSSTARLGDSIGGLITRYTSWATIIIAVRRLAQEAIRTDVEAAAAVDRLGESYTRLAQNLAPTIAWLTDRLTDLVNHTNNVVKGIKDAVAEIGRSPLLGGAGGITIPMTARPDSISAGFDSKSRNWAPGAAGFPTSGFTDLTARTEAAKKADAEQQKFFEAEADRIHKLTEAEAKRWEVGRIAREKDRAEFDKGVVAQIVGITKVQIAEEVAAGKRLETIVQLYGKIDQEREESGKKYDDEARRSREREAEEIRRYWAGVTEDLNFAGKSFWMEFAATGKANFKDLFADLKATFARVLYEMIIEARLKPIILNIIGGIGGGLGVGGAAGGLLGGAGLLGGLFGGGSAATYNGVPMGIPVTPAVGSGMWGASGGLTGMLGAGMLGAGVGGLTGMIGGNSTGGSIGGGIGGILGNLLFPGLGGLIGGAAGGLLGGMFGGKPSDMRSVSTFGANGSFSVGAQSAHEVSQQTLTMAAQASQAIMAEVTALKAFGVEFKQQLSNIWIGERDASTYQLAGGQRVGVGTVGDPTDLAVDVLTALLKGATSNDPKIQAILSGGGSSAAIASALTALQQAKDFTDAIEQAILGIKDPLKAALDLWKREAEARLAAATALGTNIDQVKELNALLYKQMVTQQNAGALSSIGGLIDQLEYGPGSSAAPNKQYASALADYEAAKKAAAGGGAAEAMAYAQTASTFLPFAREYLGTSQAYGAIETGALNTLKGLQTSLSAVPTMPSLQPVVTQVSVSGSLTVEAVKENTAVVEDLAREVKLSNALFGSVMAKFAATTP